MGVEIERRWLVAAKPTLPSHLEKITQCYVSPLGVMPVVRGRWIEAMKDGAIEKTHGLLTLKQRQEGTIAVLEPEAAISLEAYQAMASVAGASLSKTRYSIPGYGVTVELDIFNDALEGIEIVEVEFDTVEQAAAFKPLPWFGQEITGISELSNIGMAYKPQLAIETFLNLTLVRLKHDAG